jgi:hypothetical protein
MGKDYNLKLLQDFLGNHSIPRIKHHPKTFLGIARQPHYENVLSNIYAFYFNPNEEHKLKDLFIKSLQELIQTKVPDKSKEISFSNDFDIDTEYSTDNNGRIDLLLHNDTEAIIIENKVYHHLNNDLDDYWKTIKVANKTGIVLSLWNISNLGHNEFINITHFDFLKKVMENFGNYILNAEDKFIVFLKDLYQNIINLTNYMDSKYFDFYFNYEKEINQINEISSLIRNHIVSEVDNACEIVRKDLILGNKKGAELRYYQSSVNPNLMFTITLDSLFDQSRELLLIIELKDDVLSQKKGILSQDFGEHVQLIHDDFESNTNTHWAHFAFKSYSVTIKEIEHLREIIADKIKESGLMNVFETIEDFLK